jgi:hypothetical protein
LAAISVPTARRKAAIVDNATATAFFLEKGQSSAFASIDAHSHLLKNKFNRNRVSK